MRQGVLGVILVLAALPRAASGQVPAGGEFLVNTYTTSPQFGAAVAMAAAGAFAVAWASVGQDGSLDGVFGQRYDAAGAPQGAEFRVNVHTTGYQGAPAAAMDAGGNFVVASTGGCCRRR